MKITYGDLRKIIREEVARSMREALEPGAEELTSADIATSGKQAARYAAEMQAALDRMVKAAAGDPNKLKKILKLVQRLDQSVLSMSGKGSTG